jgi:hypothetical protein
MVGACSRKRSSRATSRARAPFACKAPGAAARAASRASKAAFALPSEHQEPLSLCRPGPLYRESTKSRFHSADRDRSTARAPRAAFFGDHAARHHSGAPALRKTRSRSGVPHLPERPRPRSQTSEARASSPGRPLRSLLATARDGAPPSRPASAEPGSARTHNVSGDLPKWPPRQRAGLSSSEGSPSEPTFGSPGCEASPM